MTTNKSPEKVFTVRLSGKGIQPGTVRSHELGELLDSIEESVASLACSRGISDRKEDLIVGLSEISHGSLRLAFSSPHSQTVHESFLALSSAFTESNTALLPSSVLRALKRISAFTKRHKDASAEFRSLRDDQIGFQLFSDTEIPDPALLTGVTTVFGRVLRVGGRTPRVMIDIGKKTLSCDITKTMAVALGHRLYETVSLKGRAVWDPEDYSIQEFEVTSIEEFSDLSPSEAIKELSTSLGKYFQDVSDVDDFSRKIRQGDKGSH